ncbi:hypothetical protein DL764_009774 [Monosporascus ibericus]|uniref:Creatine transporter n=1 Tax=Monosporascus ibericus TaxID=155417 RepID=A0A4Q4SU47_9PEZI|nr:hypothetical protein DL764_009774 [Monosporascus ibericus]
MDKLTKILDIFAPNAAKESDGREVWGSRLSFVLAAMGGAVGLGNLLRYPSVVFANNGLQWFIPYLIALFFLAIPVLILEISIGQAYRGGCLIAYNHISKRTKGVGVGITMTGYVVVTYYVPILAWVMRYFRSSFTNPLPWAGRPTEFFTQEVIANVDAIPGEIDGGRVVSYTSYPGTGMVGETVGWVVFTWFVVWLCMFRGIGLTGRVVYFTMGLPVVMVFILLGRALSLDNAVEGVKLYMGVWHGEKLAGGAIWQAACGQIFFSIGVGFGYFISYASYNSKFSNAVQDAVIIAACNSLYEIVGAFAVFGVIGYLGLRPGDVQLSTFTVGFLTYPEALAQIPGSNFFSVIFFLTLMLLGISSAFALLEVMVTMVGDTDIGKKISRTLLTTIAVVISLLLSLMYCTQFGLALLDAVDTWTNNLALVFIVWAECVAATTIYRCKDVFGQVGVLSYAIYNGAYLGAMIFGLAVAHSESPEAGAGMGFGLFVAGTLLALVLAKQPDSIAPGFWGGNAWLNRFWWLACYSLMRDLNVIVAAGKNWSIPVFWGPVLKYISAPILSIVFAFAYPAFYKVRNDPVHIFAFTVAHFVIVFVVLGLVVPRWFDVFVPMARRGEGDITYAPQVTAGTTDAQDANAMEGGFDHKPVNNAEACMKQEASSS